MVIRNGAKMSKSKGNVVSPDEMIARYGADATRMYSLFAAPPDRDLDWQEDGVAGVSRFLSRVYRFVMKHAHMARGASAQANSGESGGDAATADIVTADLLRKLHQTIRKITQDFGGRWHFNTSIAAIMELVNALTAADESIAAGRVGPDAIATLLENLVLILAPFAPYLAAELWEQISREDSILRHPWPKFDEALAQEEAIGIPVQINGKLRVVVTVAVNATQPEMQEAALADEKIQAAIAGKQIAKMIVVPGKLVNIVVRP
jgi:leucyl-tRNA synthetase